MKNIGLLIGSREERKVLNLAEIFSMLSHCIHIILIKNEVNLNLWKIHSLSGHGILLKNKFINYQKISNNLENKFVLLISNVGKIYFISVNIRKAQKFYLKIEDKYIEKFRIDYSSSQYLNTTST